MAVTIRLTRTGRKNWPSYRIIAAEKSRPRDGKFLEVLGVYNPRMEPAFVEMKTDRVKHWISQGAQTTEVVRGLIRKQIPGFIEEIEQRRAERAKMLRRKRKERAKQRA